MDQTYLYFVEASRRVPAMSLLLCSSDTLRINLYDVAERQARPSDNLTGRLLEKGHYVIPETKLANVITC